MVVFSKFTFMNKQSKVIFIAWFKVIVLASIVLSFSFVNQDYAAMVSSFHLCR